MNTREKGNDGEELAVTYLLTKGFTVVERNYCTKNNFHGGEIDIIARKGNRVHFIEVKSRKTDFYGMGREAVGYKKQQTIRRMATGWLLKNKLYDRVDPSFDVIEIMDGKIDFFEGCF